MAVSLELMAEKQSAHSHAIRSVDFGNDGTKIVSACKGGTIKIWDSGVNADTSQSPTLVPMAATLELKVEKQNAHAEKKNASIRDAKFSPNGKTIVSCGVDQTIKVWGTLALLAVTHQIPHHFLSLCRCLIPGFGG